jgi:hypothetical protein
MSTFQTLGNIMSSDQYRHLRLRQPEVYPSDWRRNGVVAIPRRGRQLKWLNEAREAGIWLQVSGGAEYGKDLRDLVGRGMLRLCRVAHGGIHQELSRMRLLITDKGLAALQRGRI